mmetsp:Transcript_24050/g.83465  ORF Transcript_24050/g.83465 Transcript_24050/m.83465 type:complete len:253 (-) Transcript_24050:1797-2555(-)
MHLRRMKPLLQPWQARRVLGRKPTVAFTAAAACGERDESQQDARRHVVQVPRARVGGRRRQRILHNRPQAGHDLRRHRGALAQPHRVRAHASRGEDEQCRQRVRPQRRQRLPQHQATRRLLLAALALGARRRRIVSRPLHNGRERRVVALRVARHRHRIAIHVYARITGCAAVAAGHRALHVHVASDRASGATAAAATSAAGGNRCVHLGGGRVGLAPARTPIVPRALGSERGWVQTAHRGVPQLHARITRQ